MAFFVLQILDPRLGGGDVGVDGLVERGPQLGIELFVLLAELHALELRHLERQLLEFGVPPVDLWRSCSMRRSSLAPTSPRPAASSAASSSAVIGEPASIDAECAGPVSLGLSPLAPIALHSGQRVHAGISDTLPGQAKHERIELLASQ